MTEKSRQIFKYLENEKRLIIFEGLSLKQKTKFFLEGESLALKNVQNTFKCFKYVQKIFKVYLTIFQNVMLSIVCN